MYIVGVLNNLKKNDPTFAYYADAATEAHVKSIADFSIYGIWTGQRDGIELLSIAYDGELFSK